MEFVKIAGEKLKGFLNLGNNHVTQGKEDGEHSCEQMTSQGRTSTGTSKMTGLSRSAVVSSKAPKETGRKRKRQQHPESSRYRKRRKNWQAESGASPSEVSDAEHQTDEEAGPCYCFDCRQRKRRRRLSPGPQVTYDRCETMVFESDSHDAFLQGKPRFTGKRLNGRDYAAFMFNPTLCAATAKAPQGRRRLRKRKRENDGDILELNKRVAALSGRLWDAEAEMQLLEDFSQTLAGRQREEIEHRAETVGRGVADGAQVVNKMNREERLRLQDEYAMEVERQLALQEKADDMLEDTFERSRLLPSSRPRVPPWSELKEDYWLTSVDLGAGISEESEGDANYLRLNSELAPGTPVSGSDPDEESFTSDFHSWNDSVSVQSPRYTARYINGTPHTESEYDTIRRMRECCMDLDKASGELWRQ